MAARQATAGNLKRFERSGVGSRRRGKEEGKHVRGEKTKERKISISRTRKREREIHTQEENKEGDAIDQENFEKRDKSKCVYGCSALSRESGTTIGRSFNSRRGDGEKDENRKKI